jgi:hypothetical protein
MVRVVQGSRRAAGHRLSHRAVGCQFGSLLSGPAAGTGIATTVSPSMAVNSGARRSRRRLNVTRTIRHAITELSTKVPDLAAHLDESIVTGVSLL